MNTRVLYLDKLNEHMERMVLDMCPPDVTLRFLNPTVGEKGTPEDADCFFVTTFRTTKEIIDQAPSLRLIQRPLQPLGLPPAAAHISPGLCL